MLTTFRRLLLMGTCLCLPTIPPSSLSVRIYRQYYSGLTVDSRPSLFLVHLKQVDSPWDKIWGFIVIETWFIGPLPLLKYGQSVIKFNSSSQCLGLTIDKNLSWNEHIKAVCKTFNKKLGILKRIKFLPKSILETIYFKTIIPSVLYGIAVWGSCSLALMEEVEYPPAIWTTYVSLGDGPLFLIFTRKGYYL